MDILFVTPTERPELRAESNGTMLIATKLLQARFSVELLRFSQDENYNKDYAKFVSGMVEKVVARKPKCVSFYTVWPYYHIMLRMAREIKTRAPGMIVVFGGPQASATAAATMEAMPFVDYISSGEGENTVVPFFNALLRGKGDVADVPGAFYRKHGLVCANATDNPLCELDTLPYWDERLYRKDYKLSPASLGSANYFMPIDAGRGCPYNCTFCCTSHFWRRTYRLKSPQRIIDDILYHIEKFGIRSFWFSHDAFTTNKKLVAEVCDRIIELGLDIRWKCTTRIDCITEELIVKMKQAGLVNIEVGIETGSPRMQKLTNKNLKLDQAKEKIRFMLQNKLKVVVFFMYGFPDETPEDLQQTLDLQFELFDMGVGYSTMSYCHFTPNTQITKDHFEQLVLDPQIKVLRRDVFGYDEEYQMIAENKRIFPYFYHLNTPVRNDYQYLLYFVYLFQKFPHSLRSLRALYGGDHLRLYREFCKANADCFEQEISHISHCVTKEPLQLLHKLVSSMDTPYEEKLCSLMTYEWDLSCFKAERKDRSMKKTYAFSMLDLQRRRTVDRFVDAKTTVLMERKQGTNSVKILDII